MATKEFMRMQTRILALMSREEHAQDIFLFLRMGRFGGSALLVKKSRFQPEVRIVSAMVEPIKDCVWIDKVLDSLGLGEEYRKGSVKVHSSIDSTAITPLVVYEENQAAIAWSSNPVLSQKMRHVG